MKKKMKRALELYNRYEFLQDPLDSWRKAEEIIIVDNFLKANGTGWNELKQYLEARSQKDCYNRSRDEEEFDEYYSVTIDLVFREYLHYIKTFDKLIKNNIFPVYPIDIIDVNYFLCELKSKPQNFIHVDENGYIKINKTIKII